MEIVSVCPLRISSILWQKGAASWVFTVVCKATFDLLPGESPLAADQEAPNEADEHWNDDVSRSLHAPSDMAPLKLRADVVLVGSAYAPGGAPSKSLTARLLVNKVDKAVEAFPDRVFNPRDGLVQEGAGFTRMPLVYERAAGGPGTSNPVGVRRDARDPYGRIPLPNLQPPGSRADAFEPVGFGPIAPRWPQRLERLGRHAATWSPDGWSGRPLPGDIDLAHFNVAPLDQQVTVLRENERIVLENLHREHPRLVTALPGIRPCAFVEGRTGAPFRLPMHADTLWIDTDRSVCTMVWRRQLPLERPDEPGRVVVAMEQSGQVLTWADVAHLLPVEVEADDDKPEMSTLVPPPAQPAPWEQTASAFQVRLPASTLPFVLDEPPRAQTAPFAGGALRGDGGDALPFVATRNVTAQWSAPGGEAASAPLPQAPPPAPVRAAGEGDSDVFQVTTQAPPPLPPAPVPVSQGGAGERPAIIESPWTSGVPAAVAAPAFAAAALVAPARPEPLPPAPAARAAEVTEILELLWFDGDSVPRVRRNQAWKPILAALEQQPVDRDLDDPALADAPMEMEDRREVFEILAHGAPEDAAGIDRALDAAVRKDGKFVAQLALFAGQLEFLFDELETLKATLATVAPLIPAGEGQKLPAQPLAPADEALKAAVDAAKAFLETADELTPTSVTEGMTARLRESFTPQRRGLPETHLAEQTDRVLLGQRRYQKRIVFGAPHLRCLVHLDGGAAVPAYLPESLAKKLPMFQRFKGRLIAEVQQQADQYETHHASLRVVALARATPPRRRGW